MGVKMYFLLTFIHVHMCAARPQLNFSGANRPSYSPNPSGFLISQIVPPGKPWPANAADYASFSQTSTRGPNQAPTWSWAEATTTTTRTTTTSTSTTRTPPVIPFTAIKDRLTEEQENKNKNPETTLVWSRPTIIFHEAKNPPTTTTSTQSALSSKCTDSDTEKDSEMTKGDVELKPVKTTKIVEQTAASVLRPQKLPDFALFTSAPVVDSQKQSQTPQGSRTQGQISVANLLPENVVVTVKNPSN